MHISDIFSVRVNERRSPVLLGIDPDNTRIPPHITGDALSRITNFCHAIMESCAPQICGIKIQLAYFEQYGAAGIALVEQLIKQAQSLELLVIIDGKRGDIANTASAYAYAYLHPHSSLAGDALTINPWLGADSLEPFVTAARQHNRLLFILAHTSNPDAAMFQSHARDKLTKLINNWNATDRGNNTHGRIGAVIGATNSNDLMDWHKHLPASWLLTPGLGAQQGDASVLATLRRSGANLLVPISRAILYADNGPEYLHTAAQIAADYRARLSP